MNESRCDSVASYIFKSESDYSESCSTSWMKPIKWRDSKQGSQIYATNVFYNL